jgi:DNA invertase Pin-like site-specific DNA recombinase
VAIYARQSLDRSGDLLAVQRQIEDARKLAEHRGWTVTEEYIDNSLSGSDKKVVRPAYNKLIDDYQAGRFDALICADLDRLTRQPVQLEWWIDAAEERGLKIVTTNGEADLSTDGGRLFARIKASVARAETERKGARQQRAALQRAELGKPPTGVRLTGYTAKGEVDEDEAAIVKLVYARFAEGDSIRSLVTWLQTEGIATRTGKPWGPNSVRRMLTNPRYAGRAIYQGKPNGKAGSWTPIVDGATFDLVQARISDPRRKTQIGTDRKHLGGGLYLCAACETPVVSFSKGRYYCRGCGMSRTGRHIDELVTELVRHRLAMPDLATILTRPVEGKTGELVDELERLRARRKQADEDYDAGHIDGQRYSIATQKIKAQQRDTAERLALLHRGPDFLYGPDPVAAFDAAPLMLKRATIETLMLVKLHPGRPGRRSFDPDASVEVEWKCGESPEAPDAARR